VLLEEKESDSVNKELNKGSTRVMLPEQQQQQQQQQYCHHRQNNTDSIASSIYRYCYWQKKSRDVSLHSTKKAKLQRTSALIKIPKGIYVRRINEWTGD